MIRPQILAITGLAAVSLLLAGCAGSDAETMTLAQTKSPIQLLRSEATDRILPGAVDAFSDDKELSVACKDSSEDPKELWRSWQSSALATLKPGSAWRVKQLGVQVSDSFIADGWYVSGTKDGKDRTVITRPGSVATIAFTVTEGAEDGTGATILVDATGPCVLTEGPKSDEVTKLERAN